MADDKEMIKKGDTHKMLVINENVRIHEEGGRRKEKSKIFQDSSRFERSPFL